MQENFTIQKAAPEDFEAICQLLQKAHLPIADLNPLLDNFFVAVEKNNLIAVIGMDAYGKDGLLRSAIVEQSYRNTGIATAMVDKLLAYAKEKGVTALYLITDTAEAWFSKRGFTKVAKEAVPALVLQSEEFNGLCPASAVTMFRKL